MRRVKATLQEVSFYGSLVIVGVIACLVSCSSKENLTPDQRYEAAKTVFDQTTKQYHNPSAEAKSPEKERLQKEAAAGYERLLKKYPDQEFWAAQAVRHLAAIRAVQGKLDEAVKLYASVGEKYPKQSWEVLQAWKAAADLLWEKGSKEQAKPYYQKIVNEFDKPEATQVVKLVVNGSKRRLAGEELPASSEGK